ncbi:MAG: nitroreductase family protein [Desulfatibacillaceae bacterium]|nr:nitroreductase family protein [Desulfatibacillaceae bacterium]
MDFDSFAGLVIASRTCRRFEQDYLIAPTDLEQLVELARLCPSAGNLQPLKFVVCSEPDKCERIFPHLGWAAYLTNWAGPEQGERPSAYIIILCDTSIASHPGCDHGIAAQTILLGARAKGLAGVMIGAVNIQGLSLLLALEENMHIVLAIALGKPKEKVVLEQLGPSGDIRYWRDEKDIHHVPKRPLNDILIYY